ncbi:C40 family peptidase [Effusibacillus consociatus]|uniref:C40 family peptidase n=1 Tax=Effusibacillus consociatus TaxID=1117041 RepID=A0ABV9Q214_9BACL
MRKLLIVSVCLLTLIGCQTTRSGTPRQQAVPAPPPAPAQKAFTKTPDLLRAEKTEYRNGNEIVIHARPISEADAMNLRDESVLDPKNLDSVQDYVTYMHPDKKIDRITVMNGDQNVLSVLDHTDSDSDSPHASGMAESAGAARVPIPPPGVRMDGDITPLAAPNSSREQKVAALRKVGESKLGMKYVWGHNEDRGQVGFDCSNYAEYVYHHALGYLFTTSSRKQYRTVGVRVPVAQMQAGDLVAFNNGGHVGIYMGDGRMIQMGGGTGKCTYLPLKPGSYWYKRISAVKRMF